MTPLSILILSGAIVYDGTPTRLGQAARPAVNGETLGRTYAPILVADYAEAWFAAARVIEEGKSVSKAQTALQDTWKAARIQSFRGKRLARILPRASRGDRADQPGEACAGRGPLAVVRQGAQAGPLTKAPILSPGKTGKRIEHEHEKQDPGWLAEGTGGSGARPRGDASSVVRRRGPRLARSGAGKTVLLYKAYKDVNDGAYIDYPAQTIGDCVSQGFGHGIDLLESVQISIGGSSERFEPTATEAIYGMARVDIGGELGSHSDGAVGAWAAKAVTTLGTVSRDVLGPYDGRRARAWGAEGVPEDIKRMASDHKVQTCSLVTTYEELEDALANGYPVTVCSDQGFMSERDDDGFCRASGTWGHCMLIVGVRADERPGACIFQSWGSDSPGGPIALDQPPNSFWADRDVVEAMLAQNDSWSLSNFEGYPAQVLPNHWTYDGFA